MILMKMQQPIKIQPLTEEQKLIVHKFFETGDNSGMKEGEIRFRYGRMKAYGTRIEKAEEEFSKSLKRKAESYRRFKEKEINEHVKQYRHETAGNTLTFDLIKVNERELGKSIVIGQMGNYDGEKDKQRRLHVVEVEEWKNPEYFQEIIKRYNLLID